MYLMFLFAEFTVSFQNSFKKVFYSSIWLTKDFLEPITEL